MTQSERPPLVLHVFPTFAVGGAQVLFAALANHFGAAFRHIVVSLDGNLACRERLDRSLDVTFPAVEAPKDSMLANVLRFRRLLRTWRPDVMVTCNWGAIEWAMANRPAVARHVHTEHGFGPEERDAQIRRRGLTRRLVLRHSTVVLPSRNLWRIATDMWALRPENVHYVPNGIDLERFAPRQHTVARDVPVIGTVAALRKEKNLGRLLRAFASLGAPARLIVVGDGAERAELEALARSLDVADRASFVGHVDDPSPSYAEFDVFALSSDTEQMPLAVIEAMAAGLPVAATDVGDVRAMLAEQNASFVGKLYDSDLARSLTELLADPSLRARVGRANREKAVREFDQSSMFQAYEAVWRGLPLPVAR
ncbi:MAG TPA: glycosyltransferase [Acetobacteraceae bacterium]|jgi:glycosyltransferase involved in cell wall biosynthesis